MASNLKKHFDDFPENDDVLIPLSGLHNYLPIHNGVIYELSKEGVAPPFMHEENGPEVYRVGDLRRWLFKLIYPNSPVPVSEGKGDQS